MSKYEIGGVVFIEIGGAPYWKDGDTYRKVVTEHAGAPTRRRLYDWDEIDRWATGVTTAMGSMDADDIETLIVLVDRIESEREKIENLLSYISKLDVSAIETLSDLMSVAGVTKLLHVAAQRPGTWGAILDELRKTLEAGHANEGGEGGS